MRAKLKWLGSLEVEDPASWLPDTDEWAIHLRLLAGPADGPGEESFDLVVCSAGWLGAKAREQGVVDARHHLVMDGFNWQMVRSYIDQRVSRCEGASWSDVAEKLARLGYWEFEDYTP
jgi:hypothetical protein